MPYVYSTITNDCSYCSYEKRGNELPHLKRKITIKGGTGVADKRLVTPQGVVTFVTDDEMDFLQKNEAFNRHMKRGFIRISEDKQDPEKVASDMKLGDGSEPRTPQHFKDDEAKPVEDVKSLKTKIMDKFSG